MFTGIVGSMGTMVEVTAAAEGVRLVVEAQDMARRLQPGDSISVDGVCLTVTSADDRAFEVHAVPETVGRTTVGDLLAGDRVNLELPLAASDLIGGHIVQGHVDGVGQITKIGAEGNGRRSTIDAPQEVLAYVVHKGSVAVDGVSLTVAGRTASGFEVALIPHTLDATTLGRKKVGDRVNLEVDILAKYAAEYVDGLQPGSE